MLCRKTMELCDKMHGMANTNKPKHLIQVIPIDRTDRKLWSSSAEVCSTQKCGVKVEAQADFRKEKNRVFQYAS